MRSGAQHEVDNLVAEVFRITDPGRLLDFFQLRIQRLAIKQLAGIRVAILLILNPEIGVGHITVKNVLPVFRVGLKVGGLDLFPDKLGVFRDQITFEELQVTFGLLLRELFTLNLLLQDIEQMHRVRGDFGVIKVKYPRQNFEREAGRQAVHPFINAGIIAILLIGFRFRVGIFQAFTVIDAHFRVDARVFRLFQARQNREARQRFQGSRRAGRVSQFAIIEQFFIDADLFRDAQAIRHLDDVNAVEEGLIVLVIAEGNPFRFVGVGEDNPVKRQGGDPFSTVIVPFLRRGQQRMQHLNRRFKHLYKFHQPLVGAAQGAGISVGIRIVLRIVFQFTDIHFAHQRGDILVILIAGLGFGDGNLRQD